MQDNTELCDFVHADTLAALARSHYCPTTKTQQKQQVKDCYRTSAKLKSSFLLNIKQCADFINSIRYRTGLRHYEVARFLGVKKNTISCFHSGRNTLSFEKIMLYLVLIGASDLEIARALRLTLAPPE